MAQFVVRNLEDDVKEGLRRRAKRNGRSMEDEVRHILRSAAKGERHEVKRLGSRMASRFRSIGLTEDLPEIRGERIQPAELDR